MASDNGRAGWLTFFGSILVAVITLLGTVFSGAGQEYLKHHLFRESSSSPTPDGATPPGQKPEAPRGSGDRLKKRKNAIVTNEASVASGSTSANSGNSVGQISGSGNQLNQIQGADSVVINPLGPAPAHPVTSGMGLKWNQADFCDAVRNGNLPAIREYLSGGTNRKDRFNPNTRCNGNIFVLGLPIFEGTADFPEIFKLFQNTGELDFEALNDRLTMPNCPNPSTQACELLWQAASHSRPADLRVLLDAGIDPTKYIEGALRDARTPPDSEAIFKGPLTGRNVDTPAWHAEIELLTFKQAGYKIPAI
ncbi:hypothetical protein ACPOL_3905 [Acidisarcina polymorpha]|uniref:Uncharacterized protein n=1 Tax=Acidisarcina polymorpha TaxID=2211140 RepID=A0A2Z5G306_9BACT|nr:hypothetical protein [Acidisarcina polymorpha]AXC13184.1 hypothetical protein ACPOL_3905 [Acidisarcina polymorpha]